MHRYTVPTSRDDREIAGARLWFAGAVGVWEQPDAVIGWFVDPVEDVPPGGSWQPEPDVDWQARWKATVEPVVAGPIAVVPTWLADDHQPDASIETVVVLDPGQAFGSGHHATTTLCLELLADLDLEGRTVLDVGTGTGVLAIAARLRGARRVLAVDIDPTAVEVTRQNVDRLSLDGIETAVATADEVAGTHDVVLANLVTDVVTAAAPDLAARTAPGGWLVTSGITEARADGPRSALDRAGLQRLEGRLRDGWVGDLWSRPPG